MANYRAGDVIRLTRNAVGMSQEELCDGICAVQTLSHIENNRHRIKPDTYRRLMEKMGRGVHNNCVVCMGKDMSLLEEYPFFEDAMAKRDYHTAECYLMRIREKISDFVTDRQSLKRVESLLDYDMGKIGAQEHMRQLGEAMEMTIPDYVCYLWGEKRDIVYPYREQEILTLMEIGNTYYDMREMDKAIHVYETIIRSLDAGYMDIKNAKELKLITLANLSFPLEKQEKYEEALLNAEKGLEMAVDLGYAHALVELLVSVAWNQIQLSDRVRDNQRRKQELLEAKRKMQQAYYIAAARKDKHNQMKISDYFKRYFGEGIME